MLPITPLRSTAMLSVNTQQQKRNNRSSFNTNAWKSINNHNYSIPYHDFDQPQE